MKDVTDDPRAQTTGVICSRCTKGRRRSRFDPLLTVSRQVNALEIDYADWLVAYDATNPYYATYGDSYRTVIEAAASAL